MAPNQSLYQNLSGILRSVSKLLEGAYRSYRVNGRPIMDVDTFFSGIKERLIELIKRQLNDLNSARVQTTT